MGLLDSIRPLSVSMCLRPKRICRGGEASNAEVISILSDTAEDYEIYNVEIFISDDVVGTEVPINVIPGSGSGGVREERGACYMGMPYFEKKIPEGYITGRSKLLFPRCFIRDYVSVDWKANDLYNVDGAKWVVSCVFDK